MIRKVQANREYLLGTLIRQLEELQYRTTGSQQRVKEIDREIADLTAQNLVLSRLHGKGVLNAADYTAQSDVLENKITELRIERRANVRVFYGIGNKHDNLNAANCFTKENNVFLPIASDSFGNEFALCIKGDEKGIWFYDHEASPDKKMTLVSNTFNEFINCCESEPISSNSRHQT